MTEVTWSDAPASPQLMRRMNRNRVLLALRDSGPLTRSALSRVVGLSRITVDAVASELLAEARIVETPEPPTGSPGRRAMLLEFRAESAHVAAVDIGATVVRVGIADLSGRMIAQRRADLSGAENASTVLETVRGVVHETMAATRLQDADIGALCIGTPGVVDPQTQRVMLAPQLPGWHDIDLTRELDLFPGRPVRIENEVHLAVLGEQWRGAALGIDDVAYLHLGMGVGLGIVKNGQLIRGASGGAGEIGYMPLGPADEDAPDGVGAFEHLVGGAAYTRAAQQLISRGGGATLLAAAGRAEAIDAALLYRLAIEGDTDAVQLVTSVLNDTAAGVATVAAILDPHVIIVGGGISLAGPWLRDRLDALARAHFPFASQLVLADLGEDAALLGGVRRAIDAYEYELIDLAH